LCEKEAERERRGERERERERENFFRVVRKKAQTAYKLSDLVFDLLTTSPLLKRHCNLRNDTTRAGILDETIC